MSLILTRRVGETLCIGTDVEVTVLGVKGQQVRIGVKAPKHIEVDRLEVRDRKIAARGAGHERARAWPEYVKPSAP